MSLANDKWVGPWRHDAYGRPLYTIVAEDATPHINDQVVAGGEVRSSDGYRKLAFTNPPADAATIAAEQATQDSRLGSLESTGIGTEALQGGTVGAPAEKMLWRFQPVDTAKAPFTWHIHGASFNGTWDSVMYLGYNASGAGGRVLAAEPSFRFVIEQDYEVTPDVHWLEAYMEWVPGSGASAPVSGRPLFWRFDRATGTIVGWDLKSKGVDFTHWDNDANVFARISPSGMNLGHANNAGSTSLALIPPAGYGSAFSMAHGGTTALSISTTSSTNVPISIGGSGTMWLFSKRVSIGVEDNSASLTVIGDNGGLGIQTLDGPAGQTGDHYAAKSNDKATTYFRVGPLGYPQIRKVTAIPDAYLATSELALWFDNTNGAGKLMIKAKTADGTVVTGSVALA